MATKTIEEILLELYRSIKPLASLSKFSFYGLQRNTLANGYDQNIPSCVPAQTTGNCHGLGQTNQIFHIS